MIYINRAMIAIKENMNQLNEQRENAAIHELRRQVMTDTVWYIAENFDINATRVFCIYDPFSEVYYASLPSYPTKISQMLYGVVHQDLTSVFDGMVYADDTSDTVYTLGKQMFDELVAIAPEVVDIEQLVTMFNYRHQKNLREVLSRCKLPHSTQRYSTFSSVRLCGSTT